MQETDDPGRDSGTQFAPPAKQAAQGNEPDAHGQAALLLVESLMHALVENKTLTAAQAASAVETAHAVKIDYALETGESAQRMQRSLALLSQIQRTFEIDAV